MAATAWAKAEAHQEVTQIAARKSNLELGPEVSSNLDGKKESHCCRDRRHDENQNRAVEDGEDFHQGAEKERREGETDGK